MRTKDVLALALIGLGELRVDSHGRVWRGTQRADTGRAKGYLRVQFTVEGRRYGLGAHRLVWMVFNHRLIPDGLEINHKDGNRANNSPLNLEVVMRDFNAAHALHKLGKLQARHTPGAKLTPEQVLEIDELCRRKVLSKQAIADTYGVTVKTVRNIERRVKWTHLFGC